MQTVQTMPRKTVWAAGLIILVLAALGGYQGWRRSGSDADQSADGGLPLTAPASNARAASPLAEPSAAGLTEAQVRDIARQEARAALHRPASAADDSADSDDAAPAGAASTAGANLRPAAQAPSRPAAAAPAPDRPIAAPPPTSDSPSQPPLF